MNYTSDKIKVRYNETAQMGIVHHSNYLKFFERARTQFLIDQNISQISLSSSNLAFVIHHQLPEKPEYYTHRSGRTARAGQPGPYYCTVLYDKEEIVVEDIGDDLKELLELTKSKSSPRSIALNTIVLNSSHICSEQS